MHSLSERLDSLAALVHPELLGLLWRRKQTSHVEGRQATLVVLVGYLGQQFYEWLQRWVLVMRFLELGFV